MCLSTPREEGRIPQNGGVRFASPNHLFFHLQNCSVVEPLLHGITWHPRNSYTVASYVICVASSLQDLTLHLARWALLNVDRLGCWLRALADAADAADDAGDNGDQDANHDGDDDAEGKANSGGEGAADLVALDHEVLVGGQRE